MYSYRHLDSEHTSIGQKWKDSIQQLFVGNGCQLEELPRAMADRDGEREGNSQRVDDYDDDDDLCVQA